MLSPIPRLRVRLEITNAQGFFDSQTLAPTRGDGLDEARIAFDVVKTLEPTPNTAEIKIWNLSQQTIDRITGTVRKRREFTAADRAQLYAMGIASAQQIEALTAAPVELIYDNFGISSVRLSWGYANATPTSPFPPLSVGFIGGSTSMTTEGEGQDRVLVIQAEDGSVLLGAGQLNKSYKGQTPLTTILCDLIAACGLKVDAGKLELAMQSALIARGIPVNKLVQMRTYNANTAPAADQIRSVMDSLNLRWSVQDGEFMLLDSNTVLAGVPPLLLSPADSTLFGSPEALEGQQRRVRTWANAEARPGRQALVTATTVAANYRIERARHTGDNYSGGETELTLDAVQTIPGVF